MTAVFTTRPMMPKADESPTRAFRVVHLVLPVKTKSDMASRKQHSGSHPEASASSNCIGTRMPCFDLTGIKTPECSHFVTTHTSLAMARDLDEADADTTDDGFGRSPDTLGAGLTIGPVLLDAPDVAGGYSHLLPGGAVEVRWARTATWMAAG